MSYVSIIILRNVRIVTLRRKHRAPFPPTFPQLAYPAALKPPIHSLSLRLDKKICPLKQRGRKGSSGKGRRRRKVKMSRKTRERKKRGDGNKVLLFSLSRGLPYKVYPGYTDSKHGIIEMALSAYRGFFDSKDSMGLFEGSRILDLICKKKVAD